MWIILAVLLTATGEPYLAAAGRSPIPRAGETLTKPLPYQRLAADEMLAATGEVVPWGSAHRYVNQTVTVEGTIVDTHALANLTFLNFDKDWQGKFYIVVFKAAHPPTFVPAEAYLNKKLRITGQVVLHRERPQIQVNKLSQIEVVE